MQATGRLEAIARLAAAGCVLFCVEPALPEPAPPESGDKQFEIAEASYRSLLEDGEYQEAANALKRMIAMLLAEPDPDNNAHAQLLTELALAQSQAGSYEAATENFLLAIEIIGSAQDRLSPELIPALLGLSRVYVAGGSYAQAIESYRRTLHVYQVNNGLYGEERAAIVNELSEAYFANGNYELANDMQEVVVSIVERAHPGNDITRLPSLFSRARMLNRTGSNYKAIHAYRGIIYLLEDIEGRNSLKLVSALTELSYVMADNRVIDGEDGAKKARRYLRRAVAIAEKDDSADLRTKADVYIAAGDFLSTHTPNRRDVLKRYKQGWDVLSLGDTDDLAYRDEQFCRPRLLNNTQIALPEAMAELLTNAAHRDWPKNGHIGVRYDVTPEGRPANVRVVDSMPQGTYDYVVQQHVEGFAFRPRFVDGEAVASPDQIFEIHFALPDDQLDAGRPPGDAEVLAGT